MDTEFSREHLTPSPTTQIAKLWGQPCAHLGPVGPGWAHVGLMNLAIRAGKRIFGLLPHHTWCVVARLHHWCWSVNEPESFQLCKVFMVTFNVTVTQSKECICEEDLNNLWIRKLAKVIGNGDNQLYCYWYDEHGNLYFFVKCKCQPSQGVPILRTENGELTNSGELGSTFSRDNEDLSPDKIAFINDAGGHDSLTMDVCQKSVRVETDTVIGKDLDQSIICHSKSPYIRKLRHTHTYIHMNN